MNFLCILNWIEKKERKLSVCNDGRVITIMNIKKSSLTMERTFPNKGILKKLTRIFFFLDILYNINKVETLNKQ